MYVCVYIYIHRERESLTDFEKLNPRDCGLRSPTGCRVLAGDSGKPVVLVQT